MGWGGAGRVGGLSGRFKTGRRTLGEIRDGLGMSGTGGGTLGEVRDWSGDTPGGPGRVGGPSGRYGTGRGI